MKACFKEEEKVRAFDKIAERYFNQNFGTMSKSEFDLLMFSILRDFGELQKDESGEGQSVAEVDDYGLSKLLGISQTRVRTLKQNTQLKYPREEYDWKETFANLIKNAHYDDVKKLVKLFVPDVNVLIELRHLTVTLGWYYECHLGTNLFQCPLNAFLQLCETLAGEEIQVSEEDREKIRENYKKFKNITDDDKTMIEKFLDGDIRGGFKDLLKSLSKGAIGEVLKLITPGSGLLGIAISGLAKAISEA